MSMLSNWLHPGKAYQNAAGTVRQGYDQAQQVQKPFMQPGADAGGMMSEQMRKLMNPQDLQAEWMKSYETSPMAQQDIAQATEQGMGAASSMGLMGSTPAMQGIQSGAYNIMNRDRSQYLDDLMKKYMTGLGIGKDLFSTGAQTAGQMGQQDIQGAQDIANLGIAGNQAESKRFGDIASTVGKLGLNYLTGGMGTGAMGRGMWGS